MGTNSQTNGAYPKSDAYKRLADALIADTIDLPDCTTGSWARTSKLSAVARHFVGEVLWPLGNNEWTLDAADVTTWLRLHRAPAKAAPSLFRARKHSEDTPTLLDSRSL